MSTVRHIVNNKPKQTLKHEVLVIDPSRLKADNGYIIVNVQDSYRGSGNAQLNGYREVRLRIQDILTVPGIAARLPREDPKIPGNLWIDGGFIRISE